MQQTPAHDGYNADLLALIPMDCRRVIEVGCSTGALARAYLARNPGCEYFGVEIDETFANAARRVCSQVVCANIETLSDTALAAFFPCDCVVFGDTLEHFKDPWIVLRRINRLMRGRGRLVACIPNAQHWSVQARLACGAFQYEDSGLLDRTHLRWFTRITMLQLFEATGFNVIEGMARTFAEPGRDRFLPVIRALAEVAGANAEQAAADALPLQYVVAAKPNPVAEQCECDVRENTDPQAGMRSNSRLQDLYLRVAEIVKPTLFLDVGANDGSSSRTIRTLLPDCEIHALEANPKIHSRYAPELLKAGINLWNMAADCEEGITTLHVPLVLSRAYVNGKVVSQNIHESDDTGKGSLRLRNEEATYWTAQIPAVTLDSFLESHVAERTRRSILLWLDVEGAADRVLAGATQTLGSTAAVMVELEGYAFWKDQAGPGAACDLLLKQGFIPLARDHEYGDHQFNVLFVREEIARTILPLKLEGANGLSLSGLGAVAGGPAGKIRRNKNTQTVRQLEPQPKDIPVIIPTFNTVTYARDMVRQLRNLGVNNIILFDNGSTYAPMLDFLNSPGPGVTVFSGTTNQGPRHVITDEMCLALLPQYFCLTDPDLLFNQEMPYHFLQDLAEMTDKLQIGKAGLAIDINERHLLKQDSFLIGDSQYKIWEWEQQFWEIETDQTESGDKIYKAPIDTTLAVYNKKYFNPATYLDAVRVAGRFTCRHRPWYPDSGLPKQEEDFYKAHATASFYLRADGKAPARNS